MTIVAYKYTPGEISEPELEATFAARGHTVDYLTKALRDQIHSGTLSSFVILGPRGAGKSTVVRMVALRIKQDAALQEAWLPVVFPEEQFEVTSLRDLFSATLKALAAQAIPQATEWVEKVEAEPNDEQSQQLAITALRSITRGQKKRLILFIENLNVLLEEAVSDQEKGTLRRLLMSDPFMLVVGSAVHVFDSLRNYDEAFFNYFAPVRLSRLDAEQVFELLTLRASYDGNKAFLQSLPDNRARIRAIVQLSGGNPRLVLMLYELLSQRRVHTIIEHLRHLVDQLTPLLKDEMENLPPQQRKIIHAIMEKGGTARPNDIAESIRQPLKSVTKQLHRLREAQFIELLGGGKGRAANYTIPDQLFVIWYQMRYLRKNRRRIELFVDVLRVWFEAEDRRTIIKSLVSTCESVSLQSLRDNAWTVEYIAASLSDTPYERTARDDAVRQWVTLGDVDEAASALFELSPENRSGASESIQSLLRLSRWCLEEERIPDALKIADQAVGTNPYTPQTRAEALNLRARLRERSGNTVGAVADYSEMIELAGVPANQLVQALVERGRMHEKSDDLTLAISDFSTAIKVSGASTLHRANALFQRGLTLAFHQKKWEAAVADLTEILEMTGVPVSLRVSALECRALSFRCLSRSDEAISDYTQIIELPSASAESKTKAFVERGKGWRVVQNPERALADLTTVIESVDADSPIKARAYLERGLAHGDKDERPLAIADYSAAISLADASPATVAAARVQRGLALFEISDAGHALEDATAVVSLSGAPQNDVKRALALRMVTRMELADFSELEEALRTSIANTGQHVPDELLSALYLPIRAIVRASIGRIDDALQDLKTLTTSKEVESPVVAVLIAMVVPFFHTKKDEKMLNATLAILRQWCESLPSAEQPIAFIALFSGLASPLSRELWLSTWHEYSAKANLLDADAAKFLPRVAAVLDGSDRSILEPLPPEQRELALKILERFEAQSG